MTESNNTHYDNLSKNGKLTYWRTYHSSLFEFRKHESDELSFIEKRKITIELRAIENKIFELIKNN